MNGRGVRFGYWNLRKSGWMVWHIQLSNSIFNIFAAFMFFI